ncbi:alpha/beta-Hydrolases superfamily protein [Zea mays]|nr:alpha/beta-Hydrolases superfamily protein [Zea mays]
MVCLRTNEPIFLPWLNFARIRSRVQHIHGRHDRSISTPWIRCSRNRPRGPRQIFRLERLPVELRRRR